MATDDMIEKHMFKLNLLFCPISPYCLHRLYDCCVFTKKVNVPWDDNCSTLITIRSMVSEDLASCAYVLEPVLNKS